MPHPASSSRAAAVMARPLSVGQLSSEARQQQLEQQAIKRAQRVRSALPGGGLAMKRLKERAVRQERLEKQALLGKKQEIFQKGPPQPLEGQRRQAFKALLCADAMALAKAEKTDPLLGVGRLEVALAEGTWGQGILQKDRKLLQELLHELSIHRRYEQLNLKLTDDTYPVFNNTHVVETPVVLGSGKFNTVFALKIRRASGQVVDAVFKPLKALESGWVAGMTGIPLDNPQTAMRNLATLDYAKQLGFDVIPDTCVAIIDTGRGPFDPDLGLVMERALGRSAHDTDPKILARPDVCREIMKLQWLDHLTGQGDRHRSNYFIEIKSNGEAKILGIDNDQCFGCKLTDAEGIRRVLGDPEAHEGFRGTAFPPVIDTEMAKSIMGLTDEAIRSVLGGKLSEAEIEAAIERHDSVLSCIERLKYHGAIIEPSQWADPQIQQLLNPGNSYWSRDCARAKSRQRAKGNDPAAAFKW